MAEAKRLGKHTGGRPVLGYDVVDRKLAVNPAEAKLVQRVFERFVKLGSPARLAKELNDEGYRTKLWTNRKGERCGGSVWTKAQIYRVLSNRKYVGEVEHRGQVYPGEHEAIVSRKLWEDTRRILAENRTDRANGTRAKTKALLKGILHCGSCGRSMGPTFTTQRGKRYRYYRCLTASKESHADCPVRSVPAGAIEDAVQQQLRAVFRTPELVAITCRETKAKEQTERERLDRRKGEIESRIWNLSQTLDRLAAAGDSNEAITGRIRDLGRQIDEANGELERITSELEVLRAQTVSEAEVMAALERLDPVWDELFPGEQARIVRLLVSRVEVMPDRAEIRIRGDGLRSLASELAEADPGGEVEEVGAR
ncbi:MAG: recombinase family protein [Planctomycetota bacterium]